MKATSILELCNRINDKVTYKTVRAYTKDMKEDFLVTSIISHQSRFNVSFRYHKQNGDFSAMHIIKDGNLGDIESLHCLREDNEEVEIYYLYEMPIYLEKFSLEEIVKSLLGEEYISHRMNVYKEQLKTFKTDSSPRSYNKRDKSGKEMIVPTVQVPCVSYQIKTDLEPTLSLHSLQEQEGTLTKSKIEDKIKWHRDILEAIRFRTRSLIYSWEYSEEMKSIRESVNWSELEHLPRSKNKQFQDIVFPIFDEHRGVEQELVIRRTVWTEEVNI